MIPTQTVQDELPLEAKQTHAISNPVLFVSKVLLVLVTIGTWFLWKADPTETLWKDIFPTMVVWLMVGYLIPDELPPKKRWTVVVVTYIVWSIVRPFVL